MCYLRLQGVGQVGLSCTKGVVTVSSGAVLDWGILAIIPAARERRGWLRVHCEEMKMADGLASSFRRRPESRNVADPLRPFPITHMGSRRRGNDGCGGRAFLHIWRTRGLFSWQKPGEVAFWVGLFCLCSLYRPVYLHPSLELRPQPPLSFQAADGLGYFGLAPVCGTCRLFCSGGGGAGSIPILVPPALLQLRAGLQGRYDGVARLPSTFSPGRYSRRSPCLCRNALMRARSVPPVPLEP